MAEPMTAGRIREAADRLDWEHMHPSLGQPLRALMRRQADAVHNLEQTGYRDGEAEHELVVPELRALVEAIEGATR